MQYKRIGVDCDDVIRNFIETVYKVYEDIYPEHKKDIKPINGWSLSESFPIGDAIYEFIFEEYPERIFYEDARVLPGAGEGIDILHELGYDIILITSQRKNCAPYTRKFIEYYEFPFAETHLIELDDTFSPKGKSDIPVDIMFDDNFDTLMEFYNKGIEVVCQAKPWNKKHHAKLIELHIPIVESFMQFVEYIKNREKEYANKKENN